MTPSPTPESVVQPQLDAYNARDIDALMATYADDAQQFEYPATLLAAGAAQLRERTAMRFQEPNLHARLLKRIVMGHVVIDHEEVTRTVPEVCSVGLPTARGNGGQACLHAPAPKTREF